MKQTSNWDHSFKVINQIDHSGSFHMNPEDLADNVRADSTSVVYDLKIIEEQLTGLAIAIDDVECDSKASFSKSNERMRLIMVKVQLRKKEEQLREKIVLLRCQDGSIR